MTMPHPVGLSDKQMKLVLQGAQQLLPEWRGRYLEAVVDQLLTEDVICDFDVTAAVSRVLKRMGGKAA